MMDRLLADTCNELVGLSPLDWLVHTTRARSAKAVDTGDSGRVWTFLAHRLAS